MSVNVYDKDNDRLIPIAGRITGEYVEKSQVTESTNVTEAGWVADARAVNTVNNTLNDYMTNVWKSCECIMVEAGNSGSHSFNIESHGYYRLYIVVIASMNAVNIFAGVPRSKNGDADFDFRPIVQVNSGTKVSYSNGVITTTEFTTYHMTALYKF